MVLILMVVNGLFYPKLSAAFGMTWALSCIVYSYFYAKFGVDHKGRKMGVMF